MRMSFRRKWEKIILLCSVFLALLAASGHAATGRTVVIGYYSASGMIYGAEDGAVKAGYVYEYIQEMAGYAGWRYKYVYGSFDELYRKLVRGEIDMLPYVTKTDKRLGEILFPDKPMGDEQIYLAWLKPGHLSAGLTELQGKKVGSNAGSFHNGAFSDLLAAKGINCELVLFHTMEERWRALSAGKLDFTLETGAINPNVEVSAVYTLEERYPFYLAVARNRADLLAELNAAQKQLENVNPAFIENLRKKYFKALPVQRELSEENLAWLDSHKSIRIGGYNKDAPYAVENEKGELKGIAPECTRLMLNTIGVKVPLEWKFYDGKKEALQALRAGEIDAINPYYRNYYDAEQDGVLLSQTAYLSDFSVLYLGEYTDNTLAVIATPDTRLGASYVRDNFPQAKIVPGKNGFECVDKLLAGQANCVIMHTEAMNKIAASYKKAFRIRSLHSACPVCFAVLPENAALISIIDKARPFVSDVELNAIRNRYNAAGTTSVSVENFLKAHPEVAAFVLAGFLAMALLALITKRRTERAYTAVIEKALVETEKANRTIRQQNTFNNYFLDTYEAAYYVGLDDLSITIYKRTDYLEQKYPISANYVAALNEYIEGEVHPEDRAGLAALIQPEKIKAMLAKQPEFSHNYRIIRDGAEHYIRFQAIRGADENYAAVGFKDITEEVREEREQKKVLEDSLATIRREKNRFEAVKEIINSAEWSIKFNANGEFIDTEFSKDIDRVVDNDMANSPFEWYKIVHPDDLQAANDAFYAAIADRSCRTPYDVNFRMLDRNGKYNWFHVAGRVVREPDGSGELFGIHININKRVEAEQKYQRELEEALSMAQSANKAKSNFLFNMSHDIRTPLNAITGFTVMAKKYLGEKEKVGDLLNKIDAAGQQLFNLINQVLEMSRIESGRLELDERPVNIRDEFEPLVTILAEQAKVKGLDFNYSLNNIKHWNVLADKARLGQVTLNIAGNALKYTPEGGRVDFTIKEVPCYKEGRARFVLTVADTGIGMSEGFLKELFEPFTREKSSTVSRIQGTGLGMSIVKKLVDLMGGTIEVQSELGRGTRFDITVDFPIDKAAAELQGGAAETAGQTKQVFFAGKRVLLVEDNELNREIAKDILEEFGMTVEEADDGDVAVAMVKQATDRGEYDYYDLVIMDIQMPRMNGYEATRAIRAIPRPDGHHLPVIAMTANAFEEDRRNAFAAGMDDHLAKPIDINVLKETLAKYL